MKKITLMLVLAMAANMGFAADIAPPVPTNTPMDTARAQIAKKDWTGAVATLEPYTKANAKSADGFNLLGYSYRNLKRYDESFAAYKQALTLDPKHRGAHEYIGVAYVQTKQIDKAREHLAALEKICGQRCEEYQDLKKAIGAAK